MKKLHHLLLVLIAITFNSCTMMIGNVFRLGFRMGIWSIFIIIGLIYWIISKRQKKK